MSELTFDTTVSTEAGLFFDKTATWDTGSVGSFTKAIPGDNLSSVDTVDPVAQDVVEVYVAVDATDLEAYRSGRYVDKIMKKVRKFRHTRDDSLNFLFFEHRGDSDISRSDIATMIEIQNQFADVIVSPLHPVLTDPISPAINNRKDDLGFSPFPAYRKGVERFLEIATDKGVDKPLMGTIPPIGFSRQREILVTLEDFDVQMLAVDFRGFKPTTPKHYDPVRDLIADLSKRGKIADRILYSINHKAYHPLRNRDQFPSEEVALVGSGFDIIGGTHISRTGGGPSGPKTSAKIFDPTKLVVRDVPLSELNRKWPKTATIGSDRYLSVSESTQGKLRKLVNAEGLYYSFNELQKAVKSGNERDFLATKEGFTPSLEQTLSKMVSTYQSATGPSLSDF